MRNAMREPQRWARLLATLWLGGLLCTGFLAAPAAFAVLERPLAGRFVAELFAREAAGSVLIGAVLMLVQRWQTKTDPQSQAGWDLILPAAAVFCTVLGHYGLQPWIDQAKSGKGPLSFGQLHAVSVGFFALKLALVGSLAWRHSRAGRSG